jgi:hypothetical protein
MYQEGSGVLETPSVWQNEDLSSAKEQDACLGDFSSMMASDEIMPDDAVLQPALSVPGLGLGAQIPNPPAKTVKEELGLVSLYTLYSLYIFSVEIHFLLSLSLSLSLLASAGIILTLLMPYFLFISISSILTFYTYRLLHMMIIDNLFICMEMDRARVRKCLNSLLKWLLSACTVAGSLI